MDKIIIGNDHAGVNLKFEIKKYLESINFDVINVGVDTNNLYDTSIFWSKAFNIFTVSKTKLSCN